MAELDRSLKGYWAKYPTALGSQGIGSGRPLVNPHSSYDSEGYNIGLSPEQHEQNEHSAAAAAEFDALKKMKEDAAKTLAGEGAEVRPEGDPGPKLRTRTPGRRRARGTGGDYTPQAPEPLAPKAWGSLLESTHTGLSTALATVRSWKIPGSEIPLGEAGEHLAKAKDVISEGHRLRNGYKDPLTGKFHNGASESKDSYKEATEHLEEVHKYLNLPAFHNYAAKIGVPYQIPTSDLEKLTEAKTGAVYFKPKGAPFKSGSWGGEQIETDSPQAALVRGRAEPGSTQKKKITAQDAGVTRIRKSKARKPVASTDFEANRLGKVIQDRMSSDENPVVSKIPGQKPVVNRPEAAAAAAEQGEILANLTAKTMGEAQAEKAAATASLVNKTASSAMPTDRFRGGRVSVPSIMAKPEIGAEIGANVAPKPASPKGKTGRTQFTAEEQEQRRQEGEANTQRMITRNKNARRRQQLQALALPRGRRNGEFNSGRNS